jgi:hypothetical protein
MSGSTGVGLHYELAFRDGSSSSGASTATHIYVPKDRSLYSVQATVTDVLGRTAIATQDVWVEFLSGGDGRWVDVTGGNSSIYFLGQIGRTVTGTYYDWQRHQNLSFTATLSTGDDIHIVLDDGTISFDGPLIQNSQGFRMLLTIRGGPANGQTHEFRYGS